MVIIFVVNKIIFPEGEAQKIIYIDRKRFGRLPNLFL